MKVIFQKWWANGNRQLSLISYKESWKEVGNKRMWGFRTNGAKRTNPKDTCLDIHVHLGYLILNYTNFSFQG